MVYVFLADGFEEIEAIAPIDLLRRAGIQVKTVGIGGWEITGAHGITIRCDILPEHMRLTSSLDGIVLPGGMPGTKNLERSPDVQRAVVFCAENKKYIAAICAAPSILGHLGLLEGKEAVCYPGFEEELRGAVLSAEPVCEDGNMITAKGAGVAVEFGLKLVGIFCGAKTASDLKAGIQCQ